ncbi:von Willebrand factor A domain-containing protein DDB_G0267758-like [Rhizophagus irregularis DAOM 181602=DAOM 197198]|nr:von Willebrand factor A domain-containing protein DDB_G0267758-like [Rhizophagus irregularis DAOM 181602=DAOM 197198]
MQIYGLCFIGQGVTPIPLQNVVVEANVVDMIAEVTISQTYKNVEKDTIEAFYKFPIYEAAAICGFEAEIDGQRKIKGIVKESKEAAKEYTEAVQKGHGAYLLESESEDVFQCSVGNITSGQTVIIKITYVTELKHDSETEKIRFVLPTNIAPRYGSSEYSSSSNDGKILNPDVVSYSNKADFYLDLAVTCRMTSTIQNIESPSHKISTEMNIDENPKISKVTLSEQITYLEKDFILVVKSKDLNQPRAFVEYNPETQTNCVMLTLVPTFALNATMSELIFVVDRSGSMGIEPMKKAAQALELLLHSLSEDCYFNVVSFGSRYDPLFPKSQLYSETSLSKALNLAQTMTANYGGTEVFSALKWTFENSRDDMPTSVFFLTDGGVWNVDQIVELVRENEEKKKDDLRLFSLGIGDSVSHNLVESIARAGKGYSQFVTNDERIDKKVIGMLKNALKSPIKDYNVTWANVEPFEEKELDITPMEVDKPTISFMSDDNTEPPPPTLNIFTDIKVQQAPYFIPPIYSGVRFIVYCILEKNIEPCKVISLKATSQDGPMKLDIPLDPVTLQGSKIHRLAARKLIQDLNDKKSFIHKHPKNANKYIPASFVEEQIVKLGKTYNLASKYTSFIAIDEKNIETVVSESQTIPQKRIVPQYANLNLGFGPTFFSAQQSQQQQSQQQLLGQRTIRAQSAIQPILFRQTTQSTGFGFGQTRSGFGNGFGMGQTTQPTGFGFGQTTQPTGFGLGQTTQPTGFGFGQATQPTGGFGFGQATQPTGFGLGQTTQPTGFGFGQATQPTGGFGFGQATQPTGGFGFGQATQPTGFGFGQATQPTGGFGFGQATQPTGGFGFGQATQPTGFGFGQTATQTSQPSLFGQTAAQTSQPSLFGQPTNSQTGFGFGQTATQTSQPSLFGQTTAQTSQPSLLGQPTNQPSLFGQPTNSQTGFGFGQTAAQTSQPSLFGQPTNSQTGFGFGQTATQTSQPSLFGQTTAQTSQPSLLGQPTNSQTGFGFGAQTSQPSLLGQPTNSQTGFGFDSTHRSKFAFGSFAQSPSPIINNSNINHKESQIENLFEFLRLQSFNGKFLPNRSFYEFFYKDDLSDFNNLKQEIEKELSELSEKEIEEILSNCIAIAYLKIIMFDNFKDECEMCYEKVEKVLKKMIGNIEKERIIIERGEEWIKNWRK